MIIIYHGDHFVASRQALNQDLPKNKNRFNAKKLKIESLTQALESNSLFGQKSEAVVIENLLTLPRSKQKDQLMELVLNNQDKSVFLWEKKTITPAVKKKFIKSQIKEFKTPASIFKFLDSLELQNTKSTLVYLHQSIAKDAPEFVFYMLSRRISQLIQASSDSSELKGAPWQIGKLKSQAKNFSSATLVKFHSQLLSIDYQIKTGQTDLPLATHLDLLLFNI